MEKIKNSKVIIIISLIITCLLIAFIIRLLFQKKEIQAVVYPLEVYQNEAVSFVDSTYKANHWLWEFGNGDISTERAGQYTYERPGSYQIRLTVDHSVQKEFLINVREPLVLERDSLIHIIAPEVAMQDELIVFRGVGYAREWRWAFGETQMIDAREQVAIYSYSEPGLYWVELMTEDTQYPIRHEIQILPGYQEDEDDTYIQLGNDIREKLQAIVDGKPFNPNYNHILTKYLCNDPNVIITINEDKNNDFYSYCQGLKIVDKHNLTILEVTVLPDEKNPDCLKTFKVNQIKRRSF